MASLRELLTEEGFHHKSTVQNPKLKPLMRQKQKLSQLQEIKPLPLYICNDDGKSLDSSKHKDEKGIIRNGSWSFQSKSKRVAGSASETSNSMSLVSQSSRTVGPPLDEVAIRAVIAILSGYIGRYVKDDVFRKRIRDKCNSYLVRRRRRRNHSESDGDEDDEVLVNMKLGMENVDKLVQDQGTQKQMKIKSLRNSIELLTIVASLNSKTARDASSCGIPNAHLSACAQLYLAILYKLQKNHRICARHLLQVFCDSPFLGRTYLLPDLWEHLFLPHLLHLKIWYTEEIETLLVSNECHGDEKEKKMKSLSHVYANKLDIGTSLFALYYKQWLKIGADEPPLPVVTLPPRPSHRSSRKKSSDSFISQSSINLNLYKEVFGPKLELKPPALDDQNGVLAIGWGSGSEIDENLCGDVYKCSSFKKEKTTCVGRSSRRIDNNRPELRSESMELDYYQFFSCRNIKAESLVSKYRSNNASFREQTTVLSSEFVGAITTICSSDILSKCEFAIRVITKAWLKSHGDPLIEEALKQYRVVEGILEVLFASSDDEILELAISVLAELVAKNDAIRQIILSSDRQLEIFVRLLRSTSLFLKATVLLYLAKPHAKQMSSPEWVPLLLRVLEFGDKPLTLFTVQCNPQVAAIHFLELLLTGFDEDKNLENARRVVSVGGLTMIMRRIEEGEFNERNKAASIIYCCIRAEGSCRSFLADNINKSSLLELIVLGSSKNSSGCAAFSLLTELLYLDRITKILNFLRGLKDGWGGLNTMHILFIYLRRAPPEERPLVAMILLVLDIVEDPSKSSFYRAEAIEAFVATLDCQTCNDTIQEQSARALHLLAGHFSYNGESIMEKSLLQKAGFREHCSEDSPHGKEIVVYDLSDKNYKEVDEEESWRKKAAIALVKSENKNLLLALANCMATGTPSLARASLVTVSWMSSYLHLVEDKKLTQLAFSIFTPQLIKSLAYSKNAEARVLASYSLLCLVKNSECGSILPSLDKDSLGHLQNLSLVTWAASDLISIFSKGSLQ